MTQQESLPCPRRPRRSPTLLWTPGLQIRPDAEAVPWRREAACRTGKTLVASPGIRAAVASGEAVRLLKAWLQPAQGAASGFCLPALAAELAPPSRRMPTANRPASRALADALPAHRSRPSACPQRANVRLADRRRRRPLCRLLGLAGRSPAPRALLVLGPGRRGAGRAGRGLGRALVRHGLARARADGCPAFLETGTPRNVPFYESFGFRVVGAHQAPDGGPVIWFMQTSLAPSSAAIPAW